MAEGVLSGPHGPLRSTSFNRRRRAVRACAVSGHDIDPQEKRELALVLRPGCDRALCNTPAPTAKKTARRASMGPRRLPMEAV